jgi:hypothetical protein
MTTWQIPHSAWRVKANTWSTWSESSPTHFLAANHRFCTAFKPVQLLFQPMQGLVAVNEWGCLSMAESIMVFGCQHDVLHFQTALTHDGKDHS